MKIKESPLVGIVLSDEDKKQLETFFFSNREDVEVESSNGSLQLFLEMKGYYFYKTLEWVVCWIFLFKDVKYQSLDEFEKIKIYNVNTKLDGNVKGFEFVYDGKLYSTVVQLQYNSIAIYQCIEDDV